MHKTFKYYTAFADKCFTYFVDRLNNTDTSIDVLNTSRLLIYGAHSRRKRSTRLYIGNIIKKARRENVNIKTYIIHVMVHELFHPTQNVNRVKYINNKEYRLMVEFDTEMLALSYLISNVDMINRELCSSLDIYHLLACRDKIYAVHTKRTARPELRVKISKAMWSVGGG